MAPDFSHFPVVAHAKAGVNCIGSIVPDAEGEHVKLKGNVCGAVVGNINAAILEALEQAIADQFVIHKFNELDSPKVLTRISEVCQRGECDECPGHGEHDGKTIMCVHSCHAIEGEPREIQ